MHTCDYTPHGGPECEKIATKCIQLVDYYTNGVEQIVDADTVWLCDEHYNDPELRQSMEETFDEVRY
jgi:hypothetical protein